MKNHGNLGRVYKTTHLATISPTLKDLHWAAGFLEGEGTFSNNYNSGLVGASQVNPEPLAKLLDLFGGNVRKYDNGLKKDGSKNNPVWYWFITGSRARGVMLTLYSLLSYKRQQQIKKCFSYVS